MSDMNTTIEELSNEISTNYELKIDAVAKAIVLSDGIQSLSDEIYGNFAVRNETSSAGELSARFNNIWTKNLTSSKWELLSAFNNKQNAGNYLSTSELTNFVTRDFANKNFASLSNDNIIKGMCSFLKQVYAANISAESMNIDFNKLINDKTDRCLSAYLYKLISPFVLELVNRVNEIIFYCGFTDIGHITNFDNIQDTLFEKTKLLCAKANVEEPADKEYVTIKETLNNVVNHLEIDAGFSLERMLKAGQIKHIVLSYYVYHLNNALSSVSSAVALSTEQHDNMISALSLDLGDLSTSISSYMLTADARAISSMLTASIKNINEELSDKLVSDDLSSIKISVDDISTSLSDYALLSDLLFLSSTLSSLSITISNDYALSADVKGIDDKFANYLLCTDIVGKPYLALSTQSLLEAELDSKYTKTGDYVSCDAASGQNSLMFGKVLVSGFYEPTDDNAVPETFKFYILSAAVEEDEQNEPAAE